MRVGRFAGTDRVNACGLLCVQSGHDDAVQVHPIIRLRPFPANDGGKDTGFIMRIGRCDRLCPHACADAGLNFRRNADKTGNGNVLHAAGDDRVCCVAGFNHMWRETADDSGQVGRFVNLIAQATEREARKPALPEPGFIHFWVLAEDFADDAERFRMICHHQKIERTLQLNPRSVERMHHRLTFGEAVGRVRVCGPVSGNKGISGIGRMQMGIAPKELRVRGGGSACQAGARKQGSGEKSGAHGVVPDHLYLSSSIFPPTIRNKMACSMSCLAYSSMRNLGGAHSRPRCLPPVDRHDGAIARRF